MCRIKSILSNVSILDLDNTYDSEREALQFLDAYRIALQSFIGSKVKLSFQVTQLNETVQVYNLNYDGDKCYTFYLIKD